MKKVIVVLEPGKTMKDYPNIEFIGVPEFPICPHCGHPLLNEEDAFDHSAGLAHQAVKQYKAEGIWENYSNHYTMLIANCSKCKRSYHTSLSIRRSDPFNSNLYTWAWTRSFATEEELKKEVGWYEEDVERYYDQRPISEFGKPRPWVQKGTKVGRNDLCPCGSGRKYKKCCLMN